MATTPARPRAKTKPVAAPAMVATNVRLPSALVARLDAATERRAAKLVSLGGTTSRNATIVAALEDWCDRDESAAGGPQAKG